MTETHIPEPITVTVSTALQLSGIGRTKLYQLLGRGEIASLTVGTRRLIDYASLRAFLSARGATSAS